MKGVRHWTPHPFLIRYHRLVPGKRMGFFRIRTYVVVSFFFCTFIFLSGCDYSEQKIDPDSLFLFSKPIRLEGLEAIKAPLIEGMEPPRDERLQRSFLMDWVKWEYHGNRDWIVINIRLYKRERDAERDFAEGVKFRPHSRYDRTIDKASCKIFMSGVKAIRGDMVPTRTGNYTSELILQSGNFLMSIWEVSPSKYGEKKIKYIETIGEEIRQH